MIKANAEYPAGVPASQVRDKRARLSVPDLDGMVVAATDDKVRVEHDAAHKILVRLLSYVLRRRVRHASAGGADLAWSGLGDRSFVHVR